MVESTSKQPPRVSAWLALFALGALALAILAQFGYTVLHNGFAALALFAAALGLWLVVLWTDRDPASPRVTARAFAAPARRRVNMTFAASAVVLALITFLLSGDNEFTPDNVLAWGLSIALFLYAFWEPEKSLTEWRDAIAQTWQNARARFSAGVFLSWQTLALGAILLVAACSMFYRLGETPSEMTSDHAEKILGVGEILNGARPIFLTIGPGREPILAYLTAAYVSLTDKPLDFAALKWGTALGGILVVFVTFLLARELFDDRVALIAAALTAMSKWLMIVAHIGFRSTFTPLFTALTALFLLRALKFQKRNDFLIAGVCLGAGLYSYNAFRLAPVMVAFFFVWWLAVERNVRVTEWRRYATNVAVLVALAIIVFMPLGRYMSDHPEASWYRVLTRMGTTERSFEENPFVIFADNVKNVVLMFNVTGDVAWPNNLPNDPALDIVTGGIFALGVFTAFYRIARQREMMYAHVLIALFVMLMPSALSIAFPVENPGNIRALGALPFVMIIAAAPLALLWRRLGDAPGAFARWQAVGVLAIILLVILFANYRRYFVQYDASYRSSAGNASEVAATVRAFANSVGDTQHAWIMLYPHWIDTRSVAIALGEMDWQDHTLPDANAAQMRMTDDANKLFILNTNDHANLTRLSEIYPDAQVRVYRSQTPNRDFLLVFVPGANASSDWLGSLKQVQR
ncbi:MAG: glycosyltransferase family 39 protein [Chloroflexi bacterium]|nr:glycosyltransferase family 39 protein [Chloroflexota bacterium]